MCLTLDPSCLANAKRHLFPTAAAIISCHKSDIYLQESCQNLHQYVPLWQKLSLPECRNLPSLRCIVYNAILYLGLIMTSTDLTTFQSLKDKFSIPNNRLFQHLQLRHASNTQIGSEVNPPPDICNGKGIISTLIGGKQ